MIDQAPSPAEFEFSGGEIEFVDWIRELCARPDADVGVGPGDDCAVVRRGGSSDWLLKVDTVAEGTHFQFENASAPGHATPEQAGYKALARAVSDIAAMAGAPRFALVSLTMPRSGSTANDRHGFVRGLQAAADRFGAVIVGGETGSWDGRWVVSVTLIGELPPNRGAILRSGAQPGDGLYVTGAFGGSILGRHLKPEPRLEEARWFAEQGATAMIDVSDGLAQDLWRLCQASGCGAQVDGAAVPLHEDAHRAAQSSSRTALEHALGDGEDYELLVALPQACTWNELPTRTPIARIGTFVPADAADGKSRVGAASLTIIIDGVERGLTPDGYEHRFK